MIKQIMENFDIISFLLGTATGILGSIIGVFMAFADFSKTINK